MPVEYGAYAVTFPNCGRYTLDHFLKAVLPVFSRHQMDGEGLGGRVQPENPCPGKGIDDKKEYSVGVGDMEASFLGSMPESGNATSHDNETSPGHETRHPPG
jgi:hypothetical protein